jgi:hypothetical protein
MVGAEVGAESKGVDLVLDRVAYFRAVTGGGRVPLLLCVYRCGFLGEPATFRVELFCN